MVTARILDVGAVLYGEPTISAPLSYIEAGAMAPGATVAILLPALWGTAEAMEPLLTHLARTRRVIAVTFRGLGDSAAQTAGVHNSLERAYQVHALVTCLELPQVALIGHHDSAEVALEAAALLPGKVRSIVLCSADRSGGHMAACRALASAVGGDAQLASIQSADQIVRRCHPSTQCPPLWPESIPVPAVERRACTLHRACRRSRGSGNRMEGGSKV